MFWQLFVILQCSLSVGRNWTDSAGRGRGGGTPAKSVMLKRVLAQVYDIQAKRPAVHHNHTIMWPAIRYDNRVTLPVWSFWVIDSTKTCNHGRKFQNCAECQSEVMVYLLYWGGWLWELKGFTLYCFSQSRHLSLDMNVKVMCRSTWDVGSMKMIE